MLNQNNWQSDFLISPDELFSASISYGGNVEAGSSFQELYFIIEEFLDTQNHEKEGQSATVYEMEYKSLPSALLMINNRYADWKLFSKEEYFRRSHAATLTGEGGGCGSCSNKKSDDDHDHHPKEKQFIV